TEAFVPRSVFTRRLPITPSAWPSHRAIRIRRPNAAPEISGGKPLAVTPPRKKSARKIKLKGRVSVTKHVAEAKKKHRLRRKRSAALGMKHFGSAVVWAARFMF